jgi:hypothetical protein
MIVNPDMKSNIIQDKNKPSSVSDYLEGVAASSPQRFKLKQGSKRKLGRFHKVLRFRRMGSKIVITASLLKQDCSTQSVRLFASSCSAASECLC